MTSSAGPRRAPSLLIPVELERGNAQERFRVSWTDDDIGDNLSLVEKLKAEFGVKLPPLGEIDELDLEASFSQAGASISKMPRWKVEPNEVTLRFFSFGMFLIYRDLDPKSWKDGNFPPLLSSLLEGGFREPERSRCSRHRVFLR